MYYNMVNVLPDSTRLNFPFINVLLVYQQRANYVTGTKYAQLTESNIQNTLTV